MAIIWVILLTFFVGALLGFVASLITENEKEIYQKYFRYFLLVIAIAIPLVIVFTEQNFLILVFAFSLIVFWNYADNIFRFFGIKRHKKKK